MRSFQKKIDIGLQYAFKPDSCSTKTKFSVSQRFSLKRGIQEIQAKRIEIEKASAGFTVRTY